MLTDIFSHESYRTSGESRTFIWHVVWDSESTDEHIPIKGHSTIDCRSP